MKTSCPFCETQYEVEEKFRGKEIKCPKCNETFFADEYKDVIIHVKENEKQVNDKKNIKDIEHKIKLKKTFIPEFKTPILSSALKICSFVNMIISASMIILLIAIIFFNNSNKESIKELSTILFANLFCCFVLLGLSQIITAICKTEYNTNVMLQIMIRKEKME